MFLRLHGVCVVQEEVMGKMAPVEEGVAIKMYGSRVVQLVQ